jgi:8-oxo-dGTP pyrophosphatase MutT (NUDIX family)
VARSNPSKLYPKSVWRLPKGWLDDEENGERPGPKARGEVSASKAELVQAALREVAEEGGVEAKIIGSVATERIFFKKREALRKYLNL